MAITSSAATTGGTVARLGLGRRRNVQPMGILLAPPRRITRRWTQRWGSRYGSRTPAIPVRMSTHPADDQEITPPGALTAKARIAPTAIRARAGIGFIGLLTPIAGVPVGPSAGIQYGP